MSYFYRKKEKEPPPQDLSLADFMEDWNDLRDRHSGQEQVMKAFFEDGAKSLFVRAGRKATKTTCNIEIAWRVAKEIPGSVIYYGCPTITQAVEVVWDERRLQTCDRPDDDYMMENYVKSIDNSKHIVWFKNGSHIKLVGTWNDARGRGTQPNLLIMDEIQDCDASYLDAMHPNLAAKDGRLILSGTPPRKRNHYHEWEERIKADPDGRVFHFSSFINDKIPHLNSWLEKEKNTLIQVGKEDVWIREYLAEDCFSSADRVLPDAKFLPHEEVVKKAQIWPKELLTPIAATIVHNGQLCCVVALLRPKKELFVLDCIVATQLWDKSFALLHESITSKLKSYSAIFNYDTKRGREDWRRLLYDPSDSFKDVIKGFTSCRKDFKWQERGLPLLREMMATETIFFSDKLAAIGLECQNMLMEDKPRDLEKNYPLVCCVSMIVNEYYQLEVLSRQQQDHFDKYSGLREMGLCVPPLKKKGKPLFSTNW